MDFSFVGTEFVTVLLGLILSAGFGGTLAFFKKKMECLEKLTQQFDYLQNKSQRIEKALIILVKLQEDAVIRKHPDMKPEWEAIVRELLDE